MQRPSALSTILTGGLIAGVLDITYAIGFSAYRGVAPIKVLQSVASGLLGASASQGGWSTAMLGLFLHFCIALIWAAIFYAASRQLTVLTRKAVLSGIAYGAFVYAMMNLVVVPLSATVKKVPFPILNAPASVLITGILVHMFLIGLPIALATRRAER